MHRFLRGILCKGSVFFDKHVSTERNLQLQERQKLEVYTKSFVSEQLCNSWESILMFNDDCRLVCVSSSNIKLPQTCFYRGKTLLKEDGAIFHV